MAAMMVVNMKIISREWMAEYFAEVPKILAEYGGQLIAASYSVTSAGGTLPPPDRMAILCFPSVDAITRFLADPTYLRYREAREAGSQSNIFVFDNIVTGGSGLV